MIHQMYYDSRHKERYTLSYMQPDRFLHLLFYLYASHLVHFLDLAWGVPSWVCLLLQLSLTVTAMVIIAKQGRRLREVVEETADCEPSFSIGLTSILSLNKRRCSIHMLFVYDSISVWVLMLILVPFVIGWGIQTSEK